MVDGRLARELQTIEAMVRIYCHHHHSGRVEGEEAPECPCAACGELVSYAECRLERCPYGQAKPTCSKCPIHCYRPELREQVREVMRFAGPRMLKRHPVLALRHLLDERREAPDLPRRRGREG